MSTLKKQIIKLFEDSSEEDKNKNKVDDDLELLLDGDSTEESDDAFDKCQKACDDSYEKCDASCEGDTSCEDSCMEKYNACGEKCEDLDEEGLNEARRDPKAPRVTNIKWRRGGVLGPRTSKIPEDTFKEFIDQGRDDSIILSWLSHKFRGIPLSFEWTTFAGAPIKEDNDKTVPLQRRKMILTGDKEIDDFMKQNDILMDEYELVCDIIERTVQDDGTFDSVIDQLHDDLPVLTNGRVPMKIKELAKKLFIEYGGTVPLDEANDEGEHDIDELDSREEREKLEDDEKHRDEYHDDIDKEEDEKMDENKKLKEQVKKLFKEDVEVNIPQRGDFAVAELSPQEKQEVVWTFAGECADVIEKMIESNVSLRSLYGYEIPRKSEVMHAKLFDFILAEIDRS
jgi:hypothetical protein